ncbi:MAG TPA: threonine synthase [Lachnospiraceae bacterium]|nr:threonine synthase [Lachnospiraceae bacterium]
MKNVTSAVCTECGARYAADPLTTVCPACGGILDIEYDYDYIRSSLNRETLKSRRDYSMWRYREFLPVEGTSRVPKLRVGWSPFYKADRLAEVLGIKTLYIKDDGINPTASLKDRASAMAVVKAEEAGKNIIACSSTGNAASSLAGNAAAAGMKTYIFVPERAPKGKVAQLMMFGATVISVQGSYEDTFRLSAEAIDRWGWYNRNAAINPYLMEGKKTVALEIAEQLDFKMTDYVAISVGDGCTISGVWKGFKDLYAAGFIDRLPRLISVQAEGCCPINTAAKENTAKWRPQEENTLADSIAVGVPRNPVKALKAIRESDGIPVNVSDGEILEAMRLLGHTSGVFAEPAGAAGTAGLKKALETGLIERDASCVSVVTGNGLKDVNNAIKASGEPILIPPSMQLLLKEFRKIGDSHQ